MSDKEASYSMCVGMFELSRIKPRQHVIEDIATKVLKAARLGAQLLDEGDEPLYQECHGWAHTPYDAPPDVPWGPCCDGSGFTRVWPKDDEDE